MTRICTPRPRFNSRKIYRNTYRPANMSCTPGKGQCPVGQTCARDGSSKGTCISSTVANFTAGPPLSSLPSGMQTAINNSIAKKQTTTDDAVMGKLGQPIMPGATCDGKAIIPYCQQEAYKDTTYCACQNTTTPYPECASELCQNSTSAYKTVDQREIAENPAKLCPQQNVCISSISAGGTGNIINSNQSSSCGGTVQKIMNQVKLHPVIAVVILVLIVMLAVLVASPSKKGKDLPPGMLDGIPDLGPV